MNTLKDLRALLVEDEIIAQKVHCQLLQKLGCQVDLASTGQQALEKANDNYDIIFMDMGLPDGDGTEVIRNIREQECRRRRTPIIFLTAFIQEDVKQKCLAADADAVFTKPISLTKFKEIILLHALKRDVRGGI